MRDTFTIQPDTSDERDVKRSAMKLLDAIDTLAGYTGDRREVFEAAKKMLNMSLYPERSSQLLNSIARHYLIEDLGR